MHSQNPRTNFAGILLWFYVVDNGHVSLYNTID